MIKNTLENDIWFKLMIGFFAFSCLIGGYRGGLGIFEKSYILPQWYYYINIILNTLCLIVLGFFYNFKKIGVILYLALLVLDFFIQFLLCDTYNTASFFFIFLSSLLIGVKVIPNWKKYD